MSSALPNLPPYLQADQAQREPLGFEETLGCERCGRLDSTLRASSFIYTISLIFVTFRRGAAGVYCGSCRKKEGLKYTLTSALLGWWGIPWGPIYTLHAFGRNSAGGYQDAGLNAELLQAVASELIERGDKTGAIAALEQSIRLKDDGGARQVLWGLKGELADEATSPTTETTPVTTGGTSVLPSTQTFKPGVLVRSAEGSVQMYAQPSSSREPVAKLGSETAVVTRTEAGWLELRVPGGSAGWVPETAVEFA
jgi:hypothetical protein